MTIFVQIASYRDPELVNTIEDLLANADVPQNLKICICHQYDNIRVLDKYRKDSRFIIIDIPYQESKGACWARSLIQQRYNNEDFTLQLDSHHRFIKGWDKELISMFQSLKDRGYDKPLITSYLPSYNPDKDPSERINVPWKMNFDRFIPEGAVFFLPAAIENYKDLTLPIPARFYSAHFCFTLGRFCLEVPHDPNYYFHGEEISIAVRAYTWGYDLFHPHKIIAWHEYTRKNRTKHWDDHRDWHVKNNQSHFRNRSLFQMNGLIATEDFDEYGFGSVRSLEDYEMYAGLNFKKRSVQQYTLDNKPAPNPKYKTIQEYESSFLCVFKHCIDINLKSVPEKDYDFWVVAFQDINGNEIYRKDASEEEVIKYLRDSSGCCKIWREFHTDNKPNSWCVWPHSKSKGWCEKINGSL